MKVNKKDEQFKKYIRTLADYLRTTLFHGEYEMEIIYLADEKDRNDRFVTYAEMEIDFRYLSFKLNIYPIMRKLYNEKKGWQLANTITHEMCHLLTEPLYTFAIPVINNTNQETLEEVRERQTQRIANVIMRYTPEKIYKIK